MSAALCSSTVPPASAGIEAKVIVDPALLPQVSRSAAGSARLRATGRPAWVETVRALYELTRPRVLWLVVLTVPPVFLIGRPPLRGPLQLLGVTAGIWLVGAACSAFNAWLERVSDGMMVRTRARPLPSGRRRGVAPASAAELHRREVASRDLRRADRKDHRWRGALGGKEPADGSKPRPHRKARRRVGASQADPGLRGQVAEPGCWHRDTQRLSSRPGRTAGQHRRAPG